MRNFQGTFSSCNHIITVFFPTNSIHNNGCHSLIKRCHHMGKLPGSKPWRLTLT